MITLCYEGTVVGLVFICISISSLCTCITAPFCTVAPIATACFALSCISSVLLTVFILFLIPVLLAHGFLGTVMEIIGFITDILMGLGIPENIAGLIPYVLALIIIALIAILVVITLVNITIAPGFFVIGACTSMVSILTLPVLLTFYMVTLGIMASICPVSMIYIWPITACCLYPTLVLESYILIMTIAGTIISVVAVFTGCLANMLALCTFGLIIAIILEVLCEAAVVTMTLTVTSGTGVMCCMSGMVVLWVVTLIYAILSIILWVFGWWCPAWVVWPVITIIYICGMLVVFTCFPIISLPFFGISCVSAICFASIIVPALAMCVGSVVYVALILMFACLFIMFTILVGVCLMSAYFLMQICIITTAPLVLCSLYIFGLPIECFGVLIYSFLAALAFMLLLPLWFTAWIMVFMLGITEVSRARSAAPEEKPTEEKPPEEKPPEEKPPEEKLLAKAVAEAAREVPIYGLLAVVVIFSILMALISARR